MRAPIAVLAVVLAVAAGCATPEGTGDPTASPSPTEPDTSGSQSSTGASPEPEPDTRFLLLWRAFDYERESGDGLGPGFYRAAHCSQGRYTREPPAVHVIDYPDDYSRTSTPAPSQDPWAPTGLVFAEWDQANSTRNPVGTTGWGPTVDGFEAVSGSFAVPRAFGSGAVANVTAAGGVLRVDGTALESGVPHRITATYSHTEGGSGSSTTYRVTETIGFTDLGLAKVTVEHPQNACI
jgi:hypothetical protein